MEECKLNWEISKYFKENVGITIEPDEIYIDNGECCKKFPKYCLENRHPLILSHHKGCLVMVIPEMDYYYLTKEMITIKKYCDISTWGLGYYWDDFDVITGVKWQAFKEQGLPESKKVKRFFAILDCRKKSETLGWKPTNANCMACNVSSCPFSCLIPEKMSWKKEILETDERMIFSNIIRRRVRDMYGLEISRFKVYPGTHIWLKPDTAKNTVFVYLPQDLLLEMINKPNLNNGKLLAENFKIQVRTPFDYKLSTNSIAVKFSKGNVVPKEFEEMFFNEVWKQNSKKNVLKKGFSNIENLISKRKYV